MIQNINDARQKLQDWKKVNTIKSAKAVDQFYRDYKNLNDFKVPTKQLNFLFDNNKIFCTFPGENNKFTMSDNAVSQLAGKFNIPSRFIVDNISSKQSWRKEMITNVLYDHSTNINSAFILRSVGSEIRGVLSLSYKRFDSMSLYDKFMEMGEAFELQTYYFSYDGYTTMINMVYPEPFEININGKKKFILYGVKLKHGDFGNSSLTIESTIINLVCSNGMIGEHKIKKIHRGSKIDIDTDILSQETIKKETEAEIAVMQDSIRYLMNPKNIEEFVKAYEKIGTMEIELEKGYEKLKKMGVTKLETTKLHNLMETRPNEADMNSGKNLYALIQGITYLGKLARQNDDNSRSYQLEKTAYSFMKSYV